LRAAAEALVQRDAAAARLLDQARRTDAALAAVAEPAPLDAATVGSILAGIRGDRHREIMVRPTPRLAVWSGAAMVVFLAIGFAIGVAIPASDSGDALAGLVFGAGTLTTLDSGSLL
jgi:hypothetical protein